jgi:hypothetical protein
VVFGAAEVATDEPNIKTHLFPKQLANKIQKLIVNVDTGTDKTHSLNFCKAFEAFFILSFTKVLKKQLFPLNKVADVRFEVKIVFCVF